MKEKFECCHVQTHHAMNVRQKKRLKNEKPSTERNMRSQSDSDKNFEPCRLAPKALKSRFSKLHGVRIKCTSLDFQIGKNISPKYSSCWNLQVVSALLVFRNWEPQTHISSSKLILVLLPEEAWLSLIPLLLTRHDRNFVGCTKTYNYLVRESNAKNQAFGQK